MPVMKYRYPSQSKIRNIKFSGEQVEYQIFGETQESTGFFETPTLAIESLDADLDANDNGEVTKDEIMQKLNELGVEYNPRNKKAVLMDLLTKHL